MRSAEPVFFYDLYSPYSYLAALRVDEVLPVAPRWEPVLFGAILREAHKTPWSLLDGEREAGQKIVAARARERDLPEVRWPQGWPWDSYSLAPLRAVVWAAQRDRAQAKALTMTLYALVFVDGRALDEEDIVLEAARRCELDGEAARSGAQEEKVRQALRASTAGALARGVTGIPTVAVGDTLYWGDDRLEDAAVALAG